MTLKIERIPEDGRTRLHLAGELRSNHIDEARSELEKIFPELVLDLEEICVVDRDGVRWLNACRSVGITLENCAPYIREWMLQEQP